MPEEPTGGAATATTEGGDGWVELTEAELADLGGGTNEPAGPDDKYVTKKDLKQTVLEIIKSLGLKGETSGGDPSGAPTGGDEEGRWFSPQALEARFEKMTSTIVDALKVSAAKRPGPKPDEPSSGSGSEPARPKPEEPPVVQGKAPWRVRFWGGA